MSVEQNKALARRLIKEDWSGGNLAVADELVSANIVAHFPMMTISDREAYKQFTSDLHTGFPDHHVTIEDLVGEADRVVIRWSTHGTHLGPYQGLPPTSKEVRTTGISIIRFADGRAVEEWSSWDTRGPLQQLSVAPSIALSGGGAF